MSITSLNPMGLIKCLVQNRKCLYVLVGLSLGLGQTKAAEPYLDENGYYWSGTKTNLENPVILDRAELQKLTNGRSQWVLNVDGKNLVKPAAGDFYDFSKNPRLNELTTALQNLKSRNSRVEDELEDVLRRSVKLVDNGQVGRFSDLLVRLREGSKGEAIETQMNEFIVAPDTKRLLADRDQKRQAAFDDLEKLNQRLRMEFSQKVVATVNTMVVSERALFVPISAGAKPLETDDSQEGYSESLGIPYRLMQQPDGNYFAILTNKPQPGSAGDTLELIQGDAVTAINDRPIRSPEDLERVTAPQTIVTVAKQLDGQPKRLTVQFLIKR